MASALNKTVGNLSQLEVMRLKTLFFETKIILIPTASEAGIPWNWDWTDEYKAKVRHLASILKNIAWNLVIAEANQEYEVNLTWISNGSWTA